MGPDELKQRKRRDLISQHLTSLYREWQRSSEDKAEELLRAAADRLAAEIERLDASGFGTLHASER